MQPPSTFPWDALFQLRGGVKPGLERISALCRLLGNPHCHPRIVHVAGTNGKGSSLIFLEALLLASGKTVGTTTSPHLVKLNERYRVQGQPVSDEALWQVFCQVAGAIGMNPHAPLAGYDRLPLQPSFFEISIAMAFLLLREQDFLLLETGLGGRWDATNLVEAPACLGLTPLGLDHQQYLGPTLRSIALEKLAIKKGQAPWVIGRQPPELLPLIDQELKGIPCLQLQRDFAWQGPDFACGDFSLKVPELGLAGAHQWDNAALALAAYSLLLPPAQRPAPATLAQALAAARWPGRLEQVRPDFILDGAHNAQGLETLLAHLQATYPHQRILLGLGQMADKNLAPALARPWNLALTLQPVGFNAPGSLEGAALAQAWKGTPWPCLAPRQLEDFLAHPPQGFDLVVLAGSLYLVGACKALLAGGSL